MLMRTFMRKRTFKPNYRGVQIGRILSLNMEFVFSYRRYGFQRHMENFEIIPEDLDFSEAEKRYELSNVGNL